MTRRNEPDWQLLAIGVLLIAVGTVFGAYVLGLAG